MTGFPLDFLNASWTRRPDRAWRMAPSHCNPLAINMLFSGLCPLALCFFCDIHRGGAQTLRPTRGSAPTPAPFFILSRRHAFSPPISRDKTIFSRRLSPLRIHPKITENQMVKCFLRQTSLPHCADGPCFVAQKYAVDNHFMRQMTKDGLNATFFPRLFRDVTGPGPACVSNCPPRALSR